MAIDMFAWHKAADRAEDRRALDLERILDVEQIFKVDRTFDEDLFDDDVLDGSNDLGDGSTSRKVAHRR